MQPEIKKIELTIDQSILTGQKGWRGWVEVNGPESFSNLVEIAYADGETWQEVWDQLRTTLSEYLITQNDQHQ